jgi:hypothetical protein
MELKEMKRGFVVASVMALLASVAVAQEEDRTVETATTTTVSSGANLIGELWSVNDTVPIARDQVDLRFTFKYFTDWEISDGDDFIAQPSILWGAWDNGQVSVRVPFWLGKGGDMGPFEDGNGDVYIGALWRLMDQVDYWPSLALSAEGRFPTGDGSSGVDGKVSLLLTNDYESGVRSHFNAFIQSVNGDNLESSNIDPTSEAADNTFGEINNVTARDLRWGAIVGLDGPLTADGSLRWVVDYAYQNSYTTGQDNIQLVDVGWEWALAEGQMLGMSGQFNVEQDHDDVPNYGVALTYSMALVR